MTRPGKHPSSADPVGRRRFLLAALTGVLGLHGLAGCGVSTRPAKAGRWLFDLADSDEAVFRLGEAYLRRHPDERQADQIVAALRRSVVQAGGVPDDHQATVDAVHALVRREYRLGRLLSVDGWLLSRSEARVYAAVTLLSRQGCPAGC